MLKKNKVVDTIKGEDKVGFAAGEAYFKALDIVMIEVSNESTINNDLNNSVSDL